MAAKAARSSGASPMAIWRSGRHCAVSGGGSAKASAFSAAYIGPILGPQAASNSNSMGQLRGRPPGRSARRARSG